MQEKYMYVGYDLVIKVKILNFFRYNVENVFMRCLEIFVIYILFFYCLFQLFYEQ